MTLSKQPVLDPQEGKETPGNLEPEKAGESFQNLGNAQSAVARIVALDGGLEVAKYRAPRGQSHCSPLPNPLRR